MSSIKNLSSSNINIGSPVQLKTPPNEEKSSDEQIMSPLSKRRFEEKRSSTSNKKKDPSEPAIKSDKLKTKENETDD